MSASKLWAPAAAAVPPPAGRVQATGGSARIGSGSGPARAVDTAARRAAAWGLQGSCSPHRGRREPCTPRTLHAMPPRNHWRRRAVRVAAPASPTLGARKLPCWCSSRCLFAESRCWRRL